MTRKTSKTTLTGALVGLSMAVAASGPAGAVALTSDNQFVLDFIANGDGTGNLSNLPAAVYWRWDGASTLGIRMETPTGTVGFGNFWSFNVVNNNTTPGGIDSSGSNNTVDVISAGGAFSAVSLGAYGVGVDAIEATWLMPSFDPSQQAIYIQLTMLGPSGPSDGYQMAQYLGQGGTYADQPDILLAEPSGFCAAIVGNCAILTFEEATDVAEPGTLAVFGFGLAGLAIARRRRKSRSRQPLPRALPRERRMR